MEHLISRKDWGRITIETNEVFKYVKSNLNLILNENVNIANMKLHEVANKSVFQIDLYAKNKGNIQRDKIEHLIQNLDVMFKQHIGISVETILVSVRHKNGWEN